MKIARQVVLLLCISVLLLCSWLAPMDAPATAQVDAGLQRALVSFATARAFNAVLSVAQGTQIDIQPGGIGATLSPGQALAPVNELVKHFADLMLTAAVAFGVQKVLISVSGYWVVSLALTATALAWSAFHFRQRRCPRWLQRLLVILLMLRFAVPTVVLGSDQLSQKFLTPDYAASQKAIEAASGQTTKVEAPAPASADGALDKMKAWIPRIPDVKARFVEIKLAAEQAIEHIVKLMAIFLLQTLVMPLLLLWGLYGVAKGAFAPRNWESGRVFE